MAKYTVVEQFSQNNTMSSIKELFKLKLNENDEDERERARAEPKNKTQTQTAEPDVDLSTFKRGMEDRMQGTQNVPTKKQWKDLPTLRQASAAQTRQATSNVTLPAEAGEKMSFLQSLGLQDEISDAQAEEISGHHDIDRTIGQPEPRTPGTNVATIDTMPAVINKEIAKYAPVDPDWHQIKHLPGYIKSAIRAMGRQVFGTFTKTRIEDIQVVANLGGQGPNTERELNAVAGWLQDNGQRDTDGEMNFQRSIPDYDAKFEMYSAEKFTFMVVQDDYGNYIYSWPTNDNKYGTSSQRRDKPKQLK